MDTAKMFLLTARILDLINTQLSLHLVWLVGITLYLVVSHNRRP